MECFEEALLAKAVLPAPGQDEAWKASNLCHPGAATQGWQREKTDACFRSTWQSSEQHSDVPTGGPCGTAEDGWPSRESPPLWTATPNPGLL